MANYISIHDVKKIEIETYELDDREQTKIKRFSITDKNGYLTEITCFLADDENNE